MLEDEGIISSMNPRQGKDGDIFQQDCAPGHMSRDVLLRLRFHMRLFGLWPANSPDWNMIKHVWGMMTHRISSLSNGTDEELEVRTRPCLFYFLFFTSRAREELEFGQKDDLTNGCQ
jgi:hypothetical protein